jgi:hypothetical protein
MINRAIQNPPFSLVVPPIVKYEAIGVMGKLLSVKDDYDYIYDQLFFALGTNRGLMMGEGPSFTTRIMSLQKLIMLYKTVRDLFENWIVYRFFLPIAKKNNFILTSTAASREGRGPLIKISAKKKYILPQITWYKSLDIEEEDLEKKMYVDMHSKGFISTKTLFAKFPNLDYEVERKLLEEEIGTVFDKGDGRLPREMKPMEPIEPIKPELEKPIEPMAPVEPVSIEEKPKVEERPKVPEEGE